MYDDGDFKRYIGVSKAERSYKSRNYVVLKVHHQYKWMQSTWYFVYCVLPFEHHWNTTEHKKVQRFRKIHGIFETEWKSFNLRNLRFKAATFLNLVEALISRVCGSVGRVWANQFSSENETFQINSDKQWIVVWMISFFPCMTIPH